jgi:hypothetical protein
MPKRRSLPKERGAKPTGPSRYEMKRRGLIPQHTEPMTSAPQPPNWTKPQVAPAKEPERVFGKVIGIFLRDRGFVQLEDKRGRKIYLSDGALDRFDPRYRIENGSIIECQVTEETRGLKARAVLSIRPPRSCKRPSNVHAHA